MLIIASEVTKQTSFSSSVSSSAWVLVSSMLADAPLEAESSKSIMNRIVVLAKVNARAKRKISKVGAAHMKKCAGGRDGGKEVG